MFVSRKSDGESEEQKKKSLLEKWLEENLDSEHFATLMEQAKGQGSLFTREQLKRFIPHKKEREFYGVAVDTLMLLPSFRTGANRDNLLVKMELIFKLRKGDNVRYAGIDSEGNDTLNGITYAKVYSLSGNPKIYFGTGNVHCEVTDDGPGQGMKGVSRTVTFARFIPANTETGQN